MAKGNTKDDNRAGNSDEVDALFAVPLSGFTAARNAVMLRLKLQGRGEEAEKVKALAKPPVSAWVVNQLYWKHRDEFERLLVAGATLGKAHASQLAGKPADVRAPLSAKREALSALLQLADRILRDAGHNSTPDTLRRITATLEALATRPLSDINAPIPGRLTADVAPLGFESLTALIPESGPSVPATKPEKIVATSQKKSVTAQKLAAAKDELKAAEEALQEVRIRIEDADAALKEAAAVANEREKARRRAESDLAKATADAAESQRRVQELNLKADQLKTDLDKSERGVREARAEVQKWETPR